MMERHHQFRSTADILLSLALSICILSGCASSAKVDEAPVYDKQLEGYNRSARQAFESGRFEQAAALYRKALNRAYIRDDFGAIADARYNLTICLMNQQAYNEALDVIREAKTEMTLRGRDSQVDFLLLEATALYHLNDTDSAYEITDEILAAEPQAASPIRSKTYYLRGLIAARQGDTEKLRRAVSALGQPEQPQLKADRYDLQGRLAMAENNWETAIDAFDKATASRREDLDYRRMIDALALAARACEKAGNTPGASSRYLRAGISAALQEEHLKARQWLERAEKIAISAGDNLTAGQARSHLKKLPPD